MVLHSSLFPTQFWAEKTAQDIAIIREKGKNDYFPHLPAQLSWVEFQYLLQQVCAILKTQNVTTECLVAYCGVNRFCGLLVYCATLSLGAKILMLNPAQTQAQQQTILEETSVDVFITDNTFENFSAKTTACSHLPNLDFEQPATLTLTSGSTGMPKAAVHSISAHLYNAEGVCELMEFEKTHSWLLSLPLFHVSGQGIVWRWLLKGATLYVNESKDAFFTLLKQVSHASLVPTQLQRYLAQLDYAASQKCLLGGTAIPSELVAQAQQQGITTFSGYGMTEMASTVCAVENELDNVGYPLNHREVKLENGEIWVRGKPLALGYWQKNSKIRPLVNEQGWFATKDGGEWNSKKQLVIKGRLDNMFISGGENIQPEEIEQIIFRSNLVEQVFILPIDDKEFGQRPIAIVQFKQPNLAQEVNKLKIWLSDKLEKFKQPVAYYLLDTEQYHMQGTIKISRKQLQQDIQNKRIKEIYV
ncbi:o-succinylbenzoate--CoA ligase [Mannheimia varigena]|uniref:o-succinylbenzoate--CoA ligase n=1 Tax=Mannheimia varigena TaxID=85404 RepID=UPI0003E323C5|nr:o-succinylbenzoate--CoA ligase [Mannheimia varigena]AHG77717.1 O-succinylbenzoic acid--CoA ligase [Mannheimia varigena USDA-ARS-USMARC-1312]